jgi:hypothetical protein
MLTLYSFIFYSAYNFCIRFFREKEFPWIFASGAISMTFMTTIIVMLELIAFLMLPEKINIYGAYHGYISLATFIGTTLYMYQGNRYEKILKKCSELSLRKSKLLRWISIIYFVLLFIGFFLIGSALRQHNIDH